MKKLKYDNYNLLVGEISKFIKFYSGNSGLTKQFIYNNLPRHKDDELVVLSASKDKGKIMGYVDKNAQINSRDLKIYEGETILLVRKGYAGKMHYFKDFKYTVNEDAYILTIKNQYIKRINLQWFSFYFQKLFFQIATAKGGNGTFNKSYAKKQVIEIPPIHVQEEELADFIQLEKYKEGLEKAYEKIDNLLSKVISCDKVKEYKIIDVFYLDTGQRIIKKDLYEKININENNEESIIPIYSSGTEDNGLFGYGSISWLGSEFIRKRKVSNSWDAWKNEVGENFIIDEPCVTWNTDGDAGSLFYRKNKFFPTDHCGVLIIKEDYKDDIDLEFFAHAHQYTFKQSTERGNLHKEQMSTQTFDMPDISIQREISSKISELKMLKLKIEHFLDEIDSLLSKNIQ